MITENLIDVIRDQFRINWSGLHGISHWARVYDIGMKLTDQTGADRAVVELFSIFHDSCRYNEGIDPQHGPRGAELAIHYRKTHLHQLPDDAFDLLIVACRQHTSAQTHKDITVQTCFDSDRLDLGRVRTTPDPKQLCTDAAKTPDMISWALGNGEQGKVPKNILGNYIRNN